MQLSPRVHRGRPGSDCLGIRRSHVCTRSSVRITATSTIKHTLPTRRYSTPSSSSAAPGTFSSSGPARFINPPLCPLLAAHAHLAPAVVAPAQPRTRRRNVVERAAVEAARAVLVRELRVQQRRELRARRRRDRKFRLFARRLRRRRVHRRGRPRCRERPAQYTDSRTREAGSQHGRGSASKMWRTRRTIRKKITTTGIRASLTERTGPCRRWAYTQAREARSEHYSSSSAQAEASVLPTPGQSREMWLQAHGQLLISIIIMTKHTLQSRTCSTHASAAPGTPSRCDPAAPISISMHPT
jgi:hypothetical protein